MKKYFLGIDIGGTKTRLVLLSGVKRRRLFPTELIKTPRKRWTLETELVRVIDVITRGHHLRLAGIGVGVAGVVDHRRGVVERARNLPELDGWEAARFLRRYRVPVRIENDTRCFLHAESLWGAAQGKNNAVGIAVGTGIGGGIIANGSLYYGAHDAAGEFGHMVMDAAKGRTFEDLGALRGYQKYGETNSAIGIGIANIINALDPELVIIGGGVVYTRHFDITKVRLAARKHILAPRARTAPIIKTALGESAQAIGAALLFA